ncbi:hypothetical protein [Intrasporangium mesophilum]
MDAVTVDRHAVWAIPSTRRGARRDGTLDAAGVGGIRWDEIGERDAAT